MSRFSVVQYAPSPTPWERALDRVCDWLLGTTLFRGLDIELADLGTED